MLGVGRFDGHDLGAGGFDIRAKGVVPSAEHNGALDHLGPVDGGDQRVAELGNDLVSASLSKEMGKNGRGIKNDGA